MTLTLVLFDVDGTLVDSQGHILASMDRAFATAGRPAPAREDVLGIVGLSLDVAFLKLCPDATADDRAALVDGYKQAFHDLRAEIPKSPLYPGAMDCLHTLNARDDIVLGVATGKSRRGLDHIIDSFDLHGLFVTQQVADDHPSKPHPSMATAALAESGADRGVMVGDTTFDMAMGRAAGLKTLAVNWGYHPAAELADLANASANSFAEIPTILNTLWGNDG